MIARLCRNLWGAGLTVQPEIRCPGPPGRSRHHPCKQERGMPRHERRLATDPAACAGIGARLIGGCRQGSERIAELAVARNH